MIGNFIALAVGFGVAGVVILAFIWSIGVVMDYCYRANPLPLIAFIVVLILLVASYVLTASGYHLISGL